MSLPKRVLVVQPYGIGDLLFMTPVLRALREQPAIESVDMLVGSRGGDVVKDNPHVDEIISLDKDLFHRRSQWSNLKDLYQLGVKLKKKRYDLLLDYSNRGEYGFYSRIFLAIPKRAGFSYKLRGFFHNIRLPIPEGFKDRHAADYYCDLAEKAGIPVKNRWLEFYLNPSRREAADSQLNSLIPGSWNNGYIVLSPGGGESWGKDAHFKRWPANFFSAFAAEMIKRFMLSGAIIIGSARESEMAEKILPSADFPVLNLAGRLSLSETVLCIERSRLFTGNDGGLLHLACARKKPVIGFYGPVDPLVYGPYPRGGAGVAIYKRDLACRPCYGKFRYNSSCAHRDCLTSLRPEEALSFLASEPEWAEISALLDQKPRRMNLLH